MNERPIRLYNGDIYDSKNYISKKFAAVNSCGVHVDAWQHTIRTKGRVDYHLLYVESGELTAELDGKKQVILPGGFLLYPPHVKQDYIQKTGVCYWIHFTGTKIEELLEDAGLLGVHVYQGSRHELTVTRIFERLIFHYALRTSFRELILCADLISFLTEIGKLAQIDRVANIDERLRPVVLKMNKQYAEEIDLDAYADMVGLSRGRFLHLFKEIMGVSPYAYVLDLRLSCAAELLLSSDDPVSEIAFSVGFSDPLYFSRLFKKKHHQSPEHFRRGKR